MRRLRPFAVFLLSLGVIVQGYAGVRVMAAGCPMLHAAAQAGGGMEHAGMHHPGMDHATGSADAAGQGAHCPRGVGCQSTGPAITSAMLVPTSTPSAPQVLVAPAPSFRSHTPPLLARPPAPG